MKKRFISCLILLFSLLFSGTIAMAAPTTGTINLELFYESTSSKIYPEGMEIELYYTDKTISKVESLDKLKLVTTAKTDKAGIINFADLPFGTYVLHQKNAKTDAYIFADVLINLPYVDSTGENNYVTAQPKLEPRPKPSVSPSPSPKPGGSGGKLPQTGLVQWPIPVLAIGGLTSIITGSAMLRSKGKKK